MILFFGALSFIPVFSGPQASNQEQEIQKAKIFEEIYPLISESDLYCSFLILEDKKLELRIIGAEREYEKTLFTDSDSVYLNKGRKDGLEIGQVFLVLEVGSNIGDFGPIAFKRGRARIVALEENGARAEIEKSCSQVQIGNFLIPFEEKEGILGKDLGYEFSPLEEGKKGKIIYLQTEYNQIGSGHWALIDLGKADGIQVGQQLVIYRKALGEVPVEIVGNLVVIDTQKKTSTVKILSCKDALRIGELIQTRS